MNEKFFKDLERAVNVASEHEQELLRLPNVITVGAGPERKAGKITGKAAIVVTVRSKKTAKQLEQDNEKALPNQISGVPVDVIELGKPVEAPEIVAAQKKALEVLDEIRAKWMATPNVTGLGIGYKQIKNETKFNQIVLQVFVAEKLSPDEVRSRGFTAVPPTINGVKTDVLQMPQLRPTAKASGTRADRKDPLVGGLAIGVNTKPFWFGTLGAIVFDRDSGDQLVLSNQHVMDGPAGTEVIQPAPVGLDDSLEVGFQLDICNPLHFFRLDTPNTTVGTILAGAAVGVAIAAALSDVIDPTRRGQKATPPPSGAKTLAETHKVRMDYPEMPVPGSHFKIKTEWHYQRHTDAGNFGFDVTEENVNPHALADKILVTDRKLYAPGDMVYLFAFVMPEECVPKNPNVRRAGASEVTTARPIMQAMRAAQTERKCPCERYHAVAILTPTTVDRAFPVVLRQLTSDNAGVMNVLMRRLKDDKELFAKVAPLARYGCVFYGTFKAESVPTGPWKHYLFVQTVNNVPEGTDPVIAAQTIGGLVVSQNSRPTLDVACGPFVIEDGQFDIELI